MGGDTDFLALGTVQTRAGERQKLPESPLETRQIPAAADIREQADAGFGHGKAGIFGRDAIFGRLRDADAAAHGDAVHERDHWLRIFEQQMIELIFLIEKLAPLFAIGHAGFAQHGDISAGAKAAALAMVDDHRLDFVIVAPGEQCVNHPETHIEIERMDDLGPVQADMANPPGFSDDEIFCHKFPIGGAVPAIRSCA